MANKQQLTKGEKWMLLLTGVFSLLAVCIGWWWVEINQLPVVKIPSPVMPSPNAYDDYVRAGTLIVDGTHTDALNAIGNGTWPGKPVSGVSSPAAGTKRVPTLAETEAGLKKNAPALAALRAGFAHPYQEPPCRSFNHLFPHYAKYRDLGRILFVEGEVKAHHGDYAGAMDSYLDGMYLGATCPRGGVLIGGLVGMAIQAMERFQIWPVIDHLNGPEARSAVRRMESVNHAQVPLAEVLEEEKWSGVAMLMELFRNPNWRSEMVRMLSGPSSHTPLLNYRLFLVSKREVVHNYQQYMDAVIAEAKKPYGRRKTVPVPADPINQVLCPIFAGAGDKCAVTEAHNALLLTALALHAYKAEHGAYPASLSDLAPDYLSRIPDDPFAASGPLQYKRTGKSYLLYSIGPDGSDNGGTPCKHGQRGKGSTIVPPINATSAGDIVAGVNVH